MLTYLSYFLFFIFGFGLNCAVLGILWSANLISYRRGVKELMALYGCLAFFTVQVFFTDSLYLLKFLGDVQPRWQKINLVLQIAVVVGILVFVLRLSAYSSRLCARIAPYAPFYFLLVPLYALFLLFFSGQKWMPALLNIILNGTFLVISGYLFWYFNRLKDKSPFEMLLTRLVVVAIGLVAFFLIAGLLYTLLDFSPLNRIRDWLSLFMGGALTIPCFIYTHESLLSHKESEHPTLDQSTAQRYSLSPRETEVTQELLKGLTYIEIAEKLFISLATVKTHTQSIYRKLAVRGRKELKTLICC